LAYIVNIFTVDEKAKKERYFDIYCMLCFSSSFIDTSAWRVWRL